MSYIVISAARVRAACEAFLENRDTRIYTEREQMIDRAIADSRNSLSVRLFGRDPISREEAVAHLKRRAPHEFISRWSLVSLDGLHQADEIRDLRALAIASEDGVVHLETKHASWLASFLREV